MQHSQGLQQKFGNEMAMGELAAKMQPKPRETKLTTIVDKGGNPRQVLVDSATGEQVADLGQHYVAPTTTNLQKTPVEFVNPETGDVLSTGYASYDPKDGTWMNEAGEELRADQFQPIPKPGKTQYDRAQKPPTGYEPDPENPGGLRPISGGPADRLTPEQGAKAAMIEGAQSSMELIDSLLFKTNDDGTINYAEPDYTNIFNMNMPGGGTPWTEGRTANAPLKNAIEAKIRLESGAAVPEPEVVRADERFRPSVLDSPATIRIKRHMLKQFLMQAEGFYDPVGQLGADGKPMAKINKKGEKFFEEIDKQLDTLAAEEGKPPVGADGRPIAPNVWNRYSYEQQIQLRAALEKARQEQALNGQ